MSIDLDEARELYRDYAAVELARLNAKRHVIVGVKTMESLNAFLKKNSVVFCVFSFYFFPTFFHNMWHSKPSHAYSRDGDRDYMCGIETVFISEMKGTEVLAIDEKGEAIDIRLEVLDCG